MVAVRAKRLVFIGIRTAGATSIHPEVVNCGSSAAVTSLQSRTSQTLKDRTKTLE